MPSLRLALAQFDFPVGAIAANAERITALIADARDRHKADLVVFPELALSGYPPEDLLLRPAFLAECAAAIERVATASRGIVAIVGWPQSAGSIVYNAASVLRDGRIETTYRKRELPNYAVFDERRYFDVDPDGGACVIDVRGIAVGIVICEDLWYASRSTLPCAPAPSSSSCRTRRHSSTTSMRSVMDCSRRVSPRACRDRLSESRRWPGLGRVRWTSVLADGDGFIQRRRARSRNTGCLPTTIARLRKFAPIAWPFESDESRNALAWRALVRGTRDYCTKNGFDRIWIGLSGGIDSALVLAVAVDALGADRVTAVRLPSRYTSSQSNDLAEQQARAQGVRLETVPIAAPFAGFLDALGPLFAGHAADTAEENLQSRCRGAILMALSNKFGGLLLTTGNKSEYAVGYATIYGDMCGGYAPIKDLYKSEVYALARWRNTVGGAPVIPQRVIDRAPSAELRDDQTDQDSLPPYDVLDAILMRTIDHEQSRDEIVAAGFDAGTVDHVLRLVRINEWKRHQSAPGPKVSRRAFGRERRYPITSGWR